MLMQNMKLGEYKSLDKESLRDVFLNYLDALDMPIIDYVAFGAQDTIHKTSSSIMSRLDWQKTFTEMGLASDDPVRKASFNSKASCFSLDEIDYQDNAGREVMRQRKRHNIENGIVLVKRSLGHNFMLTLATGYKNFTPYKFFIDYQKSIHRIFNDLTNLVSPCTKEYQVKIADHLQDVDAK
jgi:hypothetical protein